jgi:hypothetical protein
MLYHPDPYAAGAGENGKIAGVAVFNRYEATKAIYGTRIYATGGIVSEG